MTIEAATDTDIFRAYVQHVLIPTLRPVMWSFSTTSRHKEFRNDPVDRTGGAGVRFLPAYSPDLNPIEKMWSKLKEALRSAKARTQQP